MGAIGWVEELATNGSAPQPDDQVVPLCRPAKPRRASGRTLKGLIRTLRDVARPVIQAARAGPQRSRLSDLRVGLVGPRCGSGAWCAIPPRSGGRRNDDAARLGTADPACGADCGRKFPADTRPGLPWAP